MADRASEQQRLCENYMVNLVPENSLLLNSVSNDGSYEEPAFEPEFA